MQDFGKLLLLVGVVLAIIGILINFVGKVPWIGRLPGDLFIQRDKFTFYFPITTSILISVVLTIVLWLLSRR